MLYLFSRCGSSALDLLQLRARVISKGFLQLGVVRGNISRNSATSIHRLLADLSHDGGANRIHASLHLINRLRFMADLQLELGIVFHELLGQRLTFGNGGILFRITSLAKPTRQGHSVGGLCLQLATLTLIARGNLCLSGQW